jgi:acetyl esterase/lipase
VLERKRRRKILIALALILLIALIGLRAWRAWKHRKAAIFTAPVNCARIVKDIEYVPGSKDPFQNLDIYIPKKPKGSPIPLVIWIHGGAWVAGDKNHPPAQLILDRGYAVASINYRLSNRVAYPAQIFDCKAAIRFLRAHAAEYNLDSGHFGLWGHSAGGHLVALLGTSCGVKSLEGDLGNNDSSSDVQAVVDWAGPSDLATIAEQASANCRIDFKSPSNPVALLMGTHQSRADYLAASPVSYVRKSNPPFLVLHAQDDDVVPVKQASEFCDLLKKNSVPVLSHISPYGGHGLFRQEFLDEAMRFFDEHLHN